MRERVLELLREKQGEFVSGEDLSSKLGISRTAVWKHIQGLRREGYRIEARPRQGYLLSSLPDLLVPRELIRELARDRLGSEIHHYQTLDSTNRKAKDLAAHGAAEGTVVIAEEQTAGAGRMGRNWFSPAGKGIWMSVILRPTMLPADAPKITLLSAVATVRAIEDLYGLPAAIKWPNDVLISGKKVCGILTEMVGEMDALHYLVVGIGINANLEERDFPPPLRRRATSLKVELGRKVDRRALTVQCLRKLGQVYTLLEEEGFAPVLRLWKRYSATLGEQVVVQTPSERIEGRAVDVDADGALWVQTWYGRRRVVAGDVTLRGESP